MKTTDYKMTIIVPVYNEIENMDRIEETFKAYFAQSPVKSKVLFVDDGSTDGSFDKIRQICSENPDFEYLKSQI